MVDKQVTEAVKNYVNYQAHLNKMGSFGRVSKKERDYLLCLGVYNSGEDKWVTQKSLGIIYGHPAQTTSKLIKKMEERGFIEVGRDSRENILTLTERGEEAYELFAQGLERAPRETPVDNNVPLPLILGII